MMKITTETHKESSSVELIYFHFFSLGLFGTVPQTKILTSNDRNLGGVVWEVWFYFASGDKDRAAKIKSMTPLFCFSSMKKK